MMGGGDEVLGPMTMQCLLACDIVKVSWYFNIYYKLAQAGFFLVVCHRHLYSLRRTMHCNWNDACQINFLPCTIKEQMWYLFIQNGTYKSYANCLIFATLLNADGQ